MINFNLPWFPEWNKKNPTDIYGPIFMVGSAGAALISAVLVINYGDQFATSTLQTGPAGTGMGVVKFKADRAKPDPTLADYFSEDPYPVEPGEALARDVYENVQVLGEVPEANFMRLMNAITLWVAPDEGCAYCHANAADGNYADDDLYTKVVSRRMIEMTQNLNDVWAGHVNASGEAGINCYTCHRGQNVPSGVWFDIAPQHEVAEGWGAIQNIATAQTNSTSLPHDALPQLLVEDNNINVHSLEPRVAENPSDVGVATWQDTERTYSLMNYFAKSLGQNCTFCHNSRAFYDGAQVTPQWATAYLGIDMVQELNNDYLIPLKEAYPPERLGPVHADAPKAACLTCHLGYNKPLGGMDMVSQYPELAAPGAPDYPAIE